MAPGRAARKESCMKHQALRQATKKALDDIDHNELTLAQISKYQILPRGWAALAGGVPFSETRILLKGYRFLYWVRPADFGEQTKRLRFFFTHIKRNKDEAPLCGAEKPENILQAKFFNVAPTPLCYACRSIYLHGGAGE